MKKMLVVILVAAILVIGLGVVAAVRSAGFDEFGYNHKARVFVGPADGVDRINDGAVWGDPTYANDRLVMKWSRAWDDARFHGAAWTTDAWENNEWNGAIKGGSGEVWHYKIKWVGPCGAEGASLPDGGYCVWGQFEVLMDQGTADGIHSFLAKAVPAGYGAE